MRSSEIESKVASFREALNKKKWELNRLSKELAKCEGEMRKLNREKVFTEEAQTIIRQVAIETQEQVRHHISDLVTVAISSIMPKKFAYSFHMKLSEKRGGVECEFELRKGKSIREIFSVGGGIVDIVSMALRVSVWSLTNLRPVLVLDEPLKALSPSFRSDASLFLKELSNELGLQIIMVTHSSELIEASDKVIPILSDGEQSKIRREGNGITRQN